MSSLAATQSDGFYFPPEWRPEFGGLSKYQGSKGANQYQTHGIIRFELPFDAWCLKCGRHMSKGLRFNAKKEKAPEKYFTTQIWSFSMKCPSPSCDQNCIIKTDPENDTYNMVEGMRKMEQEFEPELNDSIIIATTDEDRHLLATDPIFRLQHEKEDKRLALSTKEHLESLIDLQDSQRERDYDMNSLLRYKNRGKRKRAAFLAIEGQKRGLNIPLVEPDESDSIISTSVKFKAKSRSFEVSERSKMSTLQSQSIFGSVENVSTEDKKLLTKPTKNQKMTASSGAAKHNAFQAAMAKQAVVKIDITRLKLSERHLPSNLRDTVQSELRVVPKPRLSESPLNTLKNDFDKRVRSTEALCMISAYCDYDSS
jgi:coiled-coil domain-containing protein 130